MKFGRMKIPSPLLYRRGYPSFNLEPSGNKNVGNRTNPNRIIKIVKNGLQNQQV